MWSARAVVLCALLTRSVADPEFPPTFKFGAASAAYQVEGGWDADGKGESIWDRYVHERPQEIRNNETGDVAADSYHLWREDVKAAAKTKLQFYRLSINWPRILPSGFTNKINEAGVKYYNDLIDALLAEGIEPIVTLYHWELPVSIQDLGGWTNPHIVKWFGNYARVIYSLYADRVKTWLTINEPVAVCDFSYVNGIYAPGIKEPIFGPYLCNRHIMLAHATAYRIFAEEFRPKYTGKISLANNALWIDPLKPEYSKYAQLGLEHQQSRYSYQIFSKEGGWPPSIEKLMLEYSLKQGFKESRLPKFTKEEIEFMKGTADFYGINYYNTYLVRPARPGEDHGVWFFDGSEELDIIFEHPPGVYYGEAKVLPVYPQGLRSELSWVKKQYGDIDILITENGFSTSGYQLADYTRVKYIRDHLEQILLSIKADNVSVIGYAAWSLIDNFEWMRGYETKFGLFEVDFEHPNRTRTPRASAHFYRCVIEKRSLDVPDSCFRRNYPAHRRTEQPTSPNRGWTVMNCGFCLNIFLLAISFINTNGELAKGILGSTQKTAHKIHDDNHTVFQPKEDDKTGLYPEVNNIKYNETEDSVFTSAISTTRMPKVMPNVTPTKAENVPENRRLMFVTSSTPGTDTVQTTTTKTTPSNTELYDYRRRIVHCKVLKGGCFPGTKRTVDGRCMRPF